ncbi:MAG: hypothetical protein AAGF49_14065, partial [Pseudomonadota bacterium]
MNAPRLQLALLATLLGTTALSHPASANDACTISGMQVNCAGDQSEGISYTTRQGVRTVVVDLLTANITPAGGTSGVVLQSFTDEETIRIDFNGNNPFGGQSGAKVEVRRNGVIAFGTGASRPDGSAEGGEDGGGAIVNINGGTFNVLPDAFPGPLIGAESFGGDGGSGKPNFGSDGSDGGGGGAAGAVTIRVGEGGGVFTSFKGTPAKNVFNAESQGGEGGRGGDKTIPFKFGWPPDESGDGGDGGAGGPASLILGLSETSGNPITADNTTDAANARVTSVGGRGGDGGRMKNDSFGGGWAGWGGDGGDGGAALLTLNRGNYSQSGAGVAFIVTSQGGDGGVGGFAKVGRGSTQGGFGGDGGTAGKVTGELNGGNIFTSSEGQTAILLLSEGGDGGTGGATDLATGGRNLGGQGGAGGNAGDVEMTSTGTITIISNSSTAGSHGVHLASIAGQGGKGGEAKGKTSQDTVGGDGGKGGTGGAVFGGL